MGHHKKLVSISVSGFVIRPGGWELVFEVMEGILSSLLPHPLTEEPVVAPSLSWMKSEWRRRLFWGHCLLYPSLQCRSPDMGTECVGRYTQEDSAPQSHSLNLPRTNAGWSEVLCWFSRLLRVDIVIYQRSQERWHLGKWEALVWVSRERLFSICSTLLLKLQRQESGLDTEPDPEFRETLRSDFSSWNISPLIGWVVGYILGHSYGSTLPHWPHAARFFLMTGSESSSLPVTASQQQVFFFFFFCTQNNI